MLSVTGSGRKFNSFGCLHSRSMAAALPGALCGRVFVERRKAFLSGGRQ